MNPDSPIIMVEVKRFSWNRRQCQTYTLPGTCPANSLLPGKRNTSRLFEIVNNYNSESETLQYFDDIAAQGIFGV